MRRWSMILNSEHQFCLPVIEQGSHIHHSCLTDQHVAHSDSETEICCVANDGFTTWSRGDVVVKCCVIVHTSL